MQNNTITVIRNSLSAANAALDLLEQVNNVPAAPVELLPATTVTSTVVEASPVVVEAAPVIVEAVVEGPSLGVRVEAELMESDYNLRTVSELCSKFGNTSSQIKQALTDADVSYVIKHRRADGAELIGLSSRN